MWQFLIKFNIHIPYNSAVSFLSVYPKDIITHVYKKNCAEKFIAALYIKAKCQQLMNKQIVVYLFNRILLSNKKGQTTDTGTNG